MTVAYLIFELRRLLRIRTILGIGTLLPVTIYVIGTLPAGDSLSGTHRGIPAAALVMVAVASIGALIGVLTHSAGIAYERADGWLRLLRATPLPPSRVVAVRATVSMVTVLPPLLAVGGAAVLLHDLRLPPGRWLLLLAVMWLGTAPFALLGLALGYALTRDLTAPVTTVTWLLFAVLGGLMVPVDSFPGWLQPVSQALPSYRYAEAGWQAVAGAPPPVTGVALTGAWTLVFGLLAAWAYRRSSTTR